MSEGAIQKGGKILTCLTSLASLFSCRRFLIQAVLDSSIKTINLWAMPVNERRCRGTLFGASTTAVLGQASHQYTINRT